MDANIAQYGAPSYTHIKALYSFHLVTRTFARGLVLDLSSVEAGTQNCLELYLYLGQHRTSESRKELLKLYRSKALEPGVPMIQIRWRRCC